MEKEGVRNIRFVPFKGDSEILSAVLGGHADFGVITFSMAPPLMAAGKIKPLAIATQDKIPAYPDIPKQILSPVRHFLIVGIVLVEIPQQNRRNCDGGKSL